MNSGKRDPAGALVVQNHEFPSHPELNKPTAEALDAIQRTTQV